MNNIQPTICIICLLLVVILEPASSVRFVGRSRVSRSSHYSSYRDSDQDLLRRRGGVSLDEKKTLFLAGSVFVSPKLRHLLFKSPGSFAIRPDFSFEEATVCNGPHTSGSKYFMCPVEFPAEVISNWTSHAELLTSDFYGSQGTQLFCCGLSQRQYCCDYSAFHRELDARRKMAASVVLIIVLVAVFAFIGIGAGALIYCCCFRNRGSGSGFSMPMFGKFNK